MGIPIQQQLFSAFMGEEEGIHSILLPDIFSPSGSQNVYMDKVGRAKKIPGYSKQNSSAVTTNADSLPGKVVGLFPYRRQVGGTITRQLLGIFDSGSTAWEMWKSTDDGVTWTFVYNFGALSGRFPDFAQFGSDLFIANGSSGPRTWSGTALTLSGGTQSPQPSAVASGAAGLLNGTYTYKVVSVEGDGGRSPGSLTSTPEGVTNGTMSVTWGTDPNTEVVGYEIYRTTGTGVTFYFSSYIDGRGTNSFTDENSDIVILKKRTLDEHGDAPPNVAFCEPHKGRVWWGKEEANPTRAYWSDPGDPDSVYANNYLDFSDTDTQGDIISGMLGNFGEQLVVFTEKTVWTVSGTGVVVSNLIDWNKQRSNAQTGSVSHRTVVRVPAGARYVSQTGDTNSTAEKGLAYFTPLGDIRLFDGQNDVVISHPVKDTLADFTYSARAAVHAVHDAERSQFIWFIPVNGETTPSKGIVWNYRWGVWHVLTQQPFTASVLTENEGDASLSLTGGPTGFVYKIFNGLTFAGSAIEAHWLTKTLWGVVNVKDDLLPALAYTKRYRWADILYKVEGNITLTVSWLAEEALDTAAVLNSTTITSGTSTLVTSGGDTVVTSDGDSLVTAIPSGHSKVFIKDTDGRYIHSTGIRLKIGDNASNGSWAIEAIALAYQLLPGLKRRSQ